MPKYLVTGSDGFIGKALVKRLLTQGISVESFDINKGDIAEKDSLNIFKDAEINHVFHLAGKTFVPDSWKNPFDFYRTNILGTTNVLEFCREQKCSLTFVSSYTYGNPDYLPIDEKHPIKSYNPYSNSKNLAEEVCNFYIKNFGIKTAIIRPFNVYGPTQSNRFLIPEIIQKAFNDELIEVMDLKPKRDFIFIDDLIEALLLSVNNTGIYNIGSGYSVSVEEIIKIVLEKAVIKKAYQSKNISRENEIFNVVADISKAKKELNWMPKTTFEEGIEICINNYLCEKEK